MPLWRLRRVVFPCGRMDHIAAGRLHHAVGWMYIAAGWKLTEVDRWLSGQGDGLST